MIIHNMENVRECIYRINTDPISKKVSKMKNKWNVVDVNSSKTIKSLREVVAEFDTLEECEKFISRSKMENLAIREAR